MNSASSMTGSPSDCACASFAPGSAPATTYWVERVTAFATFPPTASSRAMAAARVKVGSVPVNTNTFPAAAGRITGGGSMPLVSSVPASFTLTSWSGPCDGTASVRLAEPRARGPDIPLPGRAAGFSADRVRFVIDALPRGADAVAFTAGAVRSVGEEVAFTGGPARLAGVVAFTGNAARFADVAAAFTRDAVRLGAEVAFTGDAARFAADAATLSGDAVRCAAAGIGVLIADAVPFPAGIALLGEAVRFAGDAATSVAAVDRFARDAGSLGVRSAPPVPVVAGVVRARWVDSATGSSRKEAADAAGIGSAPTAA